MMTLEVYIKGKKLAGPMPIFNDKQELDKFLKRFIAPKWNYKRLNCVAIELEEKK